jgi:hypothetical protein
MGKAGGCGVQECEFCKLSAGRRQPRVNGAALENESLNSFYCFEERKIKVWGLTHTDGLRPRANPALQKGDPHGLIVETGNVFEPIAAGFLV